MMSVLRRPLSIFLFGFQLWNLFRIVTLVLPILIRFFSFKWHFECCCCCLFTVYMLQFAVYACGCHPFCINDFLLLCAALRHCLLAFAHFKMYHKIFWELLFHRMQIIFSPFSPIINLQNGLVFVLFHTYT